MLERLLAEHEGKTVEFKETTRSLLGILKTVVAFANTAGGTLVIGVKDATKELVQLDKSFSQNFGRQSSLKSSILSPYVLMQYEWTEDRRFEWLSRRNYGKNFCQAVLVGIPQILSEEERLANAISDSIFPLLTPDIEIRSVQGKELLVVRVSHGVGPYYIKSEGSERGVYVRFGSTNRAVDAEMLDSLRLLAKKVAYDELPHPKGKLDEELIRSTFQWVGKRPTGQSLENLGIETTSGGKKYPSNGGVLLFGKNRMQLFPDSLIRCARFAGVTREKILDQTDIDAPLPQAADLIIAFIERHIAKEGRIGRMQRVDIFQYPAVAIREAVMNALLHTDYAMSGCHIQIAIFEDRIEFLNPGGLPFGQTIEKALEGSSRIRNRVIARVFRELHFIEQWGSGLRRIVEACRSQGLKPPCIEELHNQFRLILYSEQREEKKVPPWTQKLLTYLRKETEISAKTATRLWKVSPRTARNRLKQLQEQGIVVRIGTSETDPNALYKETGF